MAISEHPRPGTILLCDYSAGFREPEMIKRRPVIVVSPKISLRPRLCTVVALSSSAPTPQMSYHCLLEIDPPLPETWTGDNWVKGDMVNAVGFHRLDFIRLGKDTTGKRLYRYETLTPEQLRQVLHCLLCGVGLARLTDHL
jgi:mRNA interferase MazF